MSVAKASPEMDTPDKNRISAVSLCSFEDSPVFKYINDLSPIEPVKSVRADNTLSSFAFASPSSLFTSPQLNSNRESRFSVKRHRSPTDLPNAYLLDGTVHSSRDVLRAGKRSDPCDMLLKRGSGVQLDKDSETKPSKEQFSLAIELTKVLKHGSDGCDIQMVSCEEILTSTHKEKESIGSMLKSGEDIVKHQSDPCQFEANFQTSYQTEKKEVDNESGVMNLISDNAGFLESKPQKPKVADPRADSFAVAFPRFSLGSRSLKNIDHGGSSSAEGVARAPDTILRSSPVEAANDSAAKTEGMEENCLQVSRKQRSARRRCLTFDVLGSHKKKPLRDSTNDPPTEIASINKVSTPQKQPVHTSSKKDTDDIRPIPMIGLHLNGLMNTFRDGNKLICKVGGPISLAPTTFTDSLDSQISTPVSTKRVLVCDNEISEDVPLKPNDAESVDNDVVTGERQRLDELDESGSCKRCKCRRSKCLKLYCDCFAAGLYCIGPCSCQDCFNKPIHEDLVMSTRRQIEARNPLAFAPKVITSGVSASDFLDENSKTPASARHKRGCNCRKSGCLKKYCECYLMGVGCSPSCRCVGCKNSFGHKDEPNAVTINEEDGRRDKTLNAHHDSVDVDDDDPRKIEMCARVSTKSDEAEFEMMMEKEGSAITKIPPFPSLTSSPP